MKTRGISQEALKLIACLAMLIDHIGATILLHLFAVAGGGSPVYLLYLLSRCIGRIAFPIFCFLLVEGACHTRNPKRYALRLAIGAVLSELPFDLAFFGGWTWSGQSVMLTLLIGFLALEAMKRFSSWPKKLLVLVPFVLAAALLRTDYGGAGVLIIALFGLTRELPYRHAIQCTGMGVIICALIPSWVLVGDVRLPMELLALLAMVPIAAYNGQKTTRSKVVQWAFYLFYPVHISVLWLLEQLIYA